MKTLSMALLALCGLLAGNAAAANWVKVIDNKVSKISVDTDSIRRVGDIASAWYKRDYAHYIFTEYNRKRYQSAKVLNYYNCADREVAHAQWITYAGKDATGEIISEEKVTPLHYGDITSDDTGEPLFNFVCNYKKSRRK